MLDSLHLLRLYLREHLYSVSSSGFSFFLYCFVLSKIFSRLLLSLLPLLIIVVYVYHHCKLLSVYCMVLMRNFS